MTDQLAGTARWTAAARAVESRRPDRLFDDPWAERLAGPDGFAALERHDRSDNPYVALRTWWLDNWCTRTAVGGCRQIVLLAAGLDTRAFRLVWPRARSYSRWTVLSCSATRTACSPTPVQCLAATGTR